MLWFIKMSNAAVAQFQTKYEINPKFVQSLSKLVAYDSVLICDDSGSMRDLADSDMPSDGSSWMQLLFNVYCLMYICFF